jgi:hypothetical protein
VYHTSPLQHCVSYITTITLCIVHHHYHTEYRISPLRHCVSYITTTSLSIVHLYYHTVYRTSPLQYWVSYISTTLCIVHHYYNTLMGGWKNKYIYTLWQEFTQLADKCLYSVPITWHLSNIVFFSSEHQMHFHREPQFTYIKKKKYQIPHSLRHCNAILTVYIKKNDKTWCAQATGVSDCKSASINLSSYKSTGACFEKFSIYEGYP